MEPDRERDRGRYGLCADCLHARRVKTARGSEFLLCERSETEPEYPRYPRLPILSCQGYERDPLL